MRNSTVKKKIETWFVRVEFFCLNNRELERMCVAAVEVPSFGSQGISSDDLYGSMVSVS